MKSHICSRHSSVENAFLSNIARSSFRSKRFDRLRTLTIGFVLVWTHAAHNPLFGQTRIPQISSTQVPPAQITPTPATPLHTDQWQTLPAVMQRSSVLSMDEPRLTEELQYVRLSDLTGEGNTQYTYIPARYDQYELHHHLRQARQTLALETNSRVDVVVYLNAEGTITHINYIGEQVIKNNAIAKSACDAVKKCTFTPAYRNNKPVHSVVVIPVRFVL